MAKRFTDTNKYKKPFIRGLQGSYKLLWDYLYHDCDHAGIWIVDFDIAQIYLGSDMLVFKDEALKLFNSNEIRIIPFDKGNKWFIPSFIDFQYGILNENNRAHNSVITILKQHGLYSDKGLTRVLQDPMDKDKDMDKEYSIPKFNFKKELISLGVEEQVVSDWLSVRSKKKAANTETAFNRIKSEINKSGHAANDCIKVAVEKSWSGFESEWMKPKGNFPITDPRHQTKNGTHNGNF